MYGSPNRWLQSWLLSGSAIGLIGLLLHAPAVAQSATGTPRPASGAANPAPEPSSPTSLFRSVLKSGSRGAEVSELQATLKLLGYYNGAVDGVYGQSTAAAVSVFQTAAGLNADGVVGPATWNRLFPPTPGSATTERSPAPASNGTTAASFPTPAGSQPPASTRPATPAPRPSPKPTPATAGNRPATAAVAEPVSFPILRLGMKGPAVSLLQERLRTIGVFQGAIDGVFGTETQTAVKAAQRKFRLEPDGVVGPATWSALVR